MFTGIIERIGTLSAVSSRGNYRILTIEAQFEREPLVDGESISCDGACLTVVSHKQAIFVVEASQETVARTTLGDYRAGRKVNLERALRADSRLGGHYVTGHVDSVGRVVRLRRIGDSSELVVNYDNSFDNLVVEKGSVAVNGVSLTINETHPEQFSVSLIPFTLGNTSLGSLGIGDTVNLEFDLIGKYILKQQNDRAAGRLTGRKIIESGW